MVRTQVLQASTKYDSGVLTPVSHCYKTEQYLNTETNRRRVMSHICHGHDALDFKETLCFAIAQATVVVNMLTIAKETQCIVSTTMYVTRMTIAGISFSREHISNSNFI